jgi:hypothetical protein
MVPLQFVRTRKPTGDGECPPEIERAHEINDKIQAKVSCRDLGDDEIADFKDNASDDGMFDAGDEAPPPPVRRPKPTPRVRTTRKDSAVVPARQSSSKGFDFLDRIAQSLNPEHQAQRDAERTSALFRSQQLILLQGQIRDLNQTVQTLRSQLDDSERRRVDSDRRADQLQNQIYVASVVNQAQLHRPAARPSYREPAVAAAPSESSPSSPDSDQDHRWEATYRDGGRCSWFGNGNRLNSDDDVVEVNPIDWSPSPRSPAQIPPASDSE